MNSKGTSVVETLFGPVPMDGELPAREAVGPLFDQLDFQHASQLYLWALPLVSSAQWQHVHEHVFGAKNGDLVYYRTYEDKLGLLLANASTPYLVSFLDLSQSGPMVVEIPEKEVTGILSDFWQRAMGAIGVSSPDKAPSGRCLILPPGGKTPEAAQGFRVMEATTMNVFVALRVFETDEKKALDQVKKVRIYPFSQWGQPTTTHLITPEGRKYYAGQPKGMDYWKMLHSILQKEPVEARDRFWLSALHNLGIDKGKPFSVTDRQHMILLKGAEAGELFAQVNAFAKRFENCQHWPDRQWKLGATMDNDVQSVEYYEQLNERSSYYYEASLYSRSFVLKAPSMGQIFLGAFTDSKGCWLDGSKNYTLLLPTNPPAKIYWSMSIYDVSSRTLLDNEQRKADFFSKSDDILLNGDGSITFYFGPQAPKGQRKNWLQTIPGKHWLAYLRLYFPLESYFDKTWKMGDIEEVV